MKTRTKTSNKYKKVKTIKKNSSRSKKIQVKILTKKRTKIFKKYNKNSIWINCIKDVYRKVKIVSLKISQKSLPKCVSKIQNCKRNRNNLLCLQKILIKLKNLKEIK